MKSVEHRSLFTSNGPNTENAPFSFQYEAVNENLLNLKEVWEQTTVDGMANTALS